MSYLRIVPCLCGRKPFLDFDYMKQDFRLTCINKNCSHGFKTRSGNESQVICFWRRLVVLGREHEEAKARNLEKLKLVCAGVGLNNGNNTDQLDAHTFLEHSLLPDPESGFGTRANSDVSPHRVTYGFIELPPSFKPNLRRRSGC